MRNSITIVACILATALYGTAQAEIYESKDAQGNPVFTDTPSAGAEKINLPQENIVDSVDVPPRAAPASPLAEPAPTKQAAEQGSVTVIHDSRNERLEEELEDSRPHEVLDAQRRHEVGDVETAEKIHEKKEGAGAHIEGAPAGPVARPHVGGHRR